MSDKMQTPISDVWDTITDNASFVKFTEENKNTVELAFDGNDPTQTVNTFGNLQYNFDVIEDGHVKVLSISSMRLLLQLKEYRPLDGKTFIIRRSGEGMSTDYSTVLLA